MNNIDLRLGFCSFAETATSQMLDFMVENIAELTAAEVAVLTLYKLAVFSEEPPTYQMFAMALQDLNKFLETNKDPKGSFNGHFAGWFDRPDVGNNEEREIEQSKPTWTVSGQVLYVSPGRRYVKMHLTGLSGDREEAWILTPYELPEWAFEGGCFGAKLSQDVETFDQLATKPWALREFPKSPPSPITDAELDDLYHAWDALGL